MNFESKKLREERGEVVEQRAALAHQVEEAKRSFTNEELDQYDGLTAQIEDLDQRIATAERLESLRSKSEDKAEQRSKFAAPAVHTKPKQPTRRDYDNAIRAIALNDTGYMKQEYRDSCEKLGLSLRESGHAVEFTRQQTKGTNSEGGYLTQDGPIQGVEYALKAYGGVRSVAQVVTTDHGNPLPWVTNNDTANKAAPLAELAARTNTSVVLGRTTVGAHLYATNCFPVSIEVIQDSSFPVSEMVGRVLGQRYARGTNEDYTSGTGTNECRGYLTDSVEGVEAASASLIDPDELIQYLHSIDPEYRDDPSFAFLMHDSTVSYLRQLKDANDRYIWGDGSLNSVSDLRLLGKRVVVNNDMPVIAAGAKVIAAGAWSKFIVRDAASFTIKAAHERYIDQGAVGFFGFGRTDSVLLDAGTNPIKHFVMAAA